MLHRYIRGKVSQAVVVAVLALVLTVLFHSLLVYWPYGRAFAAFAFAAVLLSLVVLALKPGPRNGWGYVFFVPVLIAGISQLLYAGENTIALSWLVAVVALATAMYWSSLPRLPYGDVRGFWPREVVQAVLWPFSSLRSYMEVLSAERHWVMIGLGIVIALPFLLIFAVLFGSADPLFEHVLSNIFSFSEGGSTIFRLLRDVVVFLFFLGAGWAMLMRVIIPAMRSWAVVAISSIIPQTVLSCLNVLFLIFLGFQIPYLMGGGSFITTYGITYADYARNGFFQLLIASAIVLALILAVHITTEFRERFTRMLGALLIVQTLVILLSAAWRLHLYIGAYGLTIDRAWAAYGICCIAVVLILTLVALAVQVESFRLRKLLSLVAVAAFTFPLLVNVEGMVVKYNIRRVEAHPEQPMDIVYLQSLSYDAIPLQVELWQRSQLPNPPVALSAMDIDYLHFHLLNQKNRLEEESWWGKTLSHDLAAEALKAVQ